MSGSERRTIHMSSYANPQLRNRLDQGDKVFDTVENFLAAFVEDPSNRRPIKRLLVATNGIAAVRCILAIRKLLVQLFRNDRIIKFICLVTEHEIQSNAEYLKQADHIVCCPGGDNKNNYANVNEIVTKAIEQKVDAVWAGWGHASENPELPRQLAAHNIVFIGPPCSAMFSLGDKIASTIIAQTLDIPTIEWSGSSIRIDNKTLQEQEHVNVTQDLFVKATVNDVNDGLRAVTDHRIGYPLMIKASEGGGGKGIRKCRNEADFRENFFQVQAEVPGSPIFIMKCVENARHIEVQLIADRYDNVIPVFTRDCSIQRRCQKIIEEAPASIASQETLYNMQKDAVKIAKLVGYESAGTVEYMYLPDEDKYYFLELNPRLQVEHPCTEMLADMNIPAIQIQIAMGLPLHRITDIRLFYGLERYGTTPLPAEIIRTDPEYSVIAARITSEDPEDFFRPSTGCIERLNFHSAQNVWGYFSVASAGKVHEFADSQFGHLFARGTTRHEAVSAMLCALQELELRASFSSQVSYLVDLLKEPDFIENKFNTQWLDNRIANKVLQKAPLPKHEMIAISGAVIGHSRVAAAFNNFKNAVERGQVLPPKDLNETFVFDLVKDMNIYTLTVTRSGPIEYLVSLNGCRTSVVIRLLGDGGLLVTHHDRSYTCNLEETSDKYKVTIGRSIVVFEKDNDPTILKSPYTGKLLNYKKQNKDWVNVGTVYASVESMKLVFNVEIKKAPGRLEYVAKEGDLLYPGSVIARLVDQKDSERYRPKPFQDKFPEWECTSDDKDKDVPETKKYLNCYEKCVNILNGSIPPGTESSMGLYVDELFSFLDSPTLPEALLKQAFEQVKARIPSKYLSQITQAMELPQFEKFGKVKELLDSYVRSLLPREVDAALIVCQSLYDTCESFENGRLTFIAGVLKKLLHVYEYCESFFENRQYDDAVTLLSQELGSDKDKVVSILYSHAQLKGKNKFMMALFGAIEKRGMHLVTPLAEHLRNIGNMFHTQEVGNHCRHLLSLNNYIKYRKFVNKVLWDLHGVKHDERSNKAVLSIEDAIQEIRKSFLQMQSSGIQADQLRQTSPWASKLLHEFFFDKDLADIALSAYISQFFKITSLNKSKLLVAGHEATVYDILVDNFASRSSVADSNRYLTLVCLSANSSTFADSSFQENLKEQLVAKYTEEGIKSNGRRSQLLLTILLNVLDRAPAECGTSDDREAQLEELPVHSEHDESLILNAEESNAKLRTALAASLPLDVNTHVIVCPTHKPLVQVDLMCSERLELWRIPSEAALVSDRLSNILVFKYDDPDKRFARLFIRENVEIPIRPAAKPKDTDFYESYHDIIKETISAQLDSACGAVNVTMRRFKKIFGEDRSYVSNHVFLHVTFPKMHTSFTTEHEDDLDHIIEESIHEQMDVLYKHHVTEVEVIFPKESKSRLVNRRVKFLDETGVTPEFGIYDESKMDVVPRKLCYQLYGKRLQAHDRIKKIEKKRSATRVSSTTYVYDYPILFGKACLEQWKHLNESSQASDPQNALFKKQFAQLTPAQREAYENGDYRQFFDEQELVVVDNALVTITDKNELRQRADNCNNETGVVAWKLHLYTPEKPKGYTIVAISNDITFQSGSFATPEDIVYSLASEYSREHKLPRVNVSCNSGARIGLADDISKSFRAKLKDPKNPSEGFEYLYLDEDEQSAAMEQIVSERMPNGLRKIKAVIGKQNENIGVENLQGSGLIAGETSAAYDEVPTYCYVTGRTVGIGAYTARLAHRVVQAKNSHIILTGAPALNTLLGKEVYSSNNQLGGVQIMYKNGVTHSIVNDDFEGIRKIVSWMSYLPTDSKEFPYCERFGLDSEPRDVVFNVEPNRPYDIRQLIDSKNSKESAGICDCNSFDEIMNDWAKTIIAGRARIGGIPIGVVSSELRNVVSVNPADPATPNSQAVEIHQAGQVWYPDSAYKTAEAINDFNRENLPLLFIASLRGFSGGQRDMYDMVLKFGAQIVDALRKYRMPVIIYIPVQGELRGGAWVVLDSKINPGFITMVADEESRGGILEPNAIVGIKFRGEKLTALQKRNDSRLLELQDDLQKAVEENGSASDSAQLLRDSIAKQLEATLKPYRKMAVEFADLHDRAERMLAKGAVQHVTDLRGTRNLFTQIFTLESAKINICERYLSDCFRNVSRQSAYKWVCSELDKFEAGASKLSPALQIEVLNRFVTSGAMDSKLDEVADEEFEKVQRVMSARKARKEAACKK